MSFKLDTNFESQNTPSGGFATMQEVYSRHQPTLADYSRYGRYALEHASIIATPSKVLERNEVLTNPSQIECTTIIVNGEVTTVPFAYFRQEPVSFHLGKTKSVPYLILRDKQDKVFLTQYSDAMTLPGEDPRVMRGIRLASPTGKIHTGWCISTVIATPKPENPADVESIKQVFYWGPNLSQLEPVVEIADLKNTCIFPVCRITRDATDTAIDIFGRPHPDITYNRVSGLTQLTKESVLSGKNLTDGFLPPNIHVGVNTVKAVSGWPNLRELDIHEAYTPITKQGKILHYRLGRYGFDLLSGKITPLGVIAARSDFPEAEAKPPENGVKDYTDVLYGSVGNPNLGIMVTGVSDRHVGLATVVRV
ncbi:MAG: hypothetical protein NVS1B7_7730 [Candidatus Saccharimonadales bacterium]